ncbi:MAG: hypothetical protein Q8L48_17670 [Archangium sp.]|nr:hypothetical protein [Archangium sp.]
MRFLAIALLLAACTKPPPPAVSHAAIAFRDDVPGYQKLASEKYALHYLERSYESVEYVEANATDDGQARLLAAISAAAGKHHTVDLFFLSHGNRYDTWVATLAAPVRAKLRLVYNTGAGDARQGSSWLALGARAYVGHPGGNVAPLFLTYFLPRWVKGVDLRTAVDEANKETKDDLSGSLVKGVAGVVDSVGGPHLDPPKLWAGTEAQLHGDPTLVVK